MANHESSGSDRIDAELALIEGDARARAAERAGSARRWGVMAAAVPVVGAAASLVSVAALVLGSVSHFIAGGGAALAGIAAVVAATVPSSEYQRDATDHAHRLMRLSMDIHYSRTFEAGMTNAERMESLKIAARRWMDIDAELPVVPATAFLTGPVSTLFNLQSPAEEPPAPPAPSPPAPSPPASAPAPANPAPAPEPAPGDPSEPVVVPPNPVPDFT
jgi:hypothetical protein